MSRFMEEGIPDSFQESGKAVVTPWSPFVSGPRVGDGGLSGIRGSWHGTDLCVGAADLRPGLSEGVDVSRGSWGVGGVKGAERESASERQV